MSEVFPRPDLKTVKRFDRPGPRYTSYPTAVEFHEGVGKTTYLERLAQADAAVTGRNLLRSPRSQASPAQ